MPNSDHSRYDEALATSGASDNASTHNTTTIGGVTERAPIHGSWLHSSQSWHSDSVYIPWEVAFLRVNLKWWEKILKYFLMVTKMTDLKGFFSDALMLEKYFFFFSLDLWQSQLIIRDVIFLEILHAYLSPEKGNINNSRTIGPQYPLKLTCSMSWSSIVHITS